MNRCVFFCDEFGTLPKIESAEMMFSASRSRRLQIVPIIQSFAQLEKNYGKEGGEIIVDNTQITLFGGFAPNSSSAETLSKALGSRTSCAVLIETIRRVASSDKKHGELYFAFTTLGEVGNMGAEVAANVIAPDRAVIVDGVQAYDTPDVPGELNITKLGAGAVISGIDAKTVFAHARVDEVIKCAEENGIKYQYIVRQSQVGEGAVVQRALGGCECIGISIPTRYKKSASETVCEKDIEQAAALILAQI